MELNELKDLLTKQRDETKSLIDECVKAHSDAATAQIKASNDKIAELEKGIKAVEEAIAKKSQFGYTDGCEKKDAAKWSWQKFFRALTIQNYGGKGNIPYMQDPWAEAQLEKGVMQEYYQDRKKAFSESAVFDPGYAKDFSVGDGSSGGFIVPPAVYMGQIIETVYANTAILNLPVMRLEGLMGDLPLPVDSGNLTAYWIGENSKPTNTTGSFNLEWLRPRKLGVFTKISNRLLAFSNYAIDAIIREKMANDGAVKLADGLINGLGTQYQPKGLFSYTGSMTTGTALGTNGGRFGIDNLAALKQKLAVANELRDTQTYGALMRPEVKWGMLRERAIYSSSQSMKNGLPLLPQLMLDQTQLESAIRGKIEDTTLISNALTKGTSSTCSRVVYGDFSKFVYASFREPIFRVSDVAGDGSTGSALLDDQIYMVMFMECDSVCTRPTAFATIADAETNESNW